MRDVWVVYGAVVCGTVMDDAAMDNGFVRDPVDKFRVVDGVVIDVNSPVVVDTASEAAGGDNSCSADGVVDVGTVHGAVDDNAVLDNSVVDGAGRSITSAS